MKFSVFCASLLLAFAAQAQVKAVTEAGEEVLLHDDGTWSFVNQTPAPLKEIGLNPNPFSTPAASTFQLKSKKTKFAVNLNAKDWTFKKSGDNEDAEYELDYKSGDLFALLIPEQIEIPLETLRNIAIQNARNAAPDLQIVEEEYRMVNGQKMLYMQMNGTVQGVKISYMGYYFSSSVGTVQFLTYTSQNLLDSFRSEALKLLNGLCIQP